MLETMGIREAAQRYNLPVHALRRWIGTGDIPACRTGKRFLICAANIERFLLNGNTSPAAIEPPQNEIRLLR